MTLAPWWPLTLQFTHCLCHIDTATATTTATTTATATAMATATATVRFVPVWRASDVVAVSVSVASIGTACREEDIPFCYHDK